MGWNKGNVKVFQKVSSSGVTPKRMEDQQIPGERPGISMR